jgi:hypothetical protein
MGAFTRQERFAEIAPMPSALIRANAFPEPQPDR